MKRLASMLSACAASAGAAVLPLFLSPSSAMADFVFYQAHPNGYLPSQIGAGNATGFQNHSSGTTSFDFDNITSASNPTGAWYMNLNDPNTSSSAAFYRTDGFSITTGDYYVTATVRVNSLTAGEIIIDHVQKGSNNHSAIQMYLNAGADHAIGGTGIDADTVQLFDYNTSQVLLSSGADLANFHSYTLQRSASAGDYQIFIDGVCVNSVAISSFSNAANGDTEQTFPYSGGAAIANYDVQYYAYDTANVLFTTVPEPASLGLIFAGIGYATMRRRRA